jgi:hypothetical protein
MRPGPRDPLGTIGTVPRAYEGIEGRKNKNKEIVKYENIIQNSNSKIHSLKKIAYTINLPAKWGVCEKSTFLRLCLAKGTVGV